MKNIFLDLRNDINLMKKIISKLFFQIFEIFEKIRTKNQRI